MKIEFVCKTIINKITLWFKHRMLTIQVLDFSKMKESRNTWVSLLALNGKWELFLPKALIHSFRANRDLLISAPSIPEIKTKEKLKNKLQIKI